ncbi:MAG: fumarylacetoacetate hydrolase family protein [Candidatus Methanomethylophilaceae archaeon]|nr:fumarylacetoacetate hydrolase family protein [Candidatus Methanomethylophilaceae archaeon]
MKPGKIVCIGWNYRSHVTELESELPEVPAVFLKPSSCMVGDGDDIVIPEGVTNVQHEVELALVIGVPGRCIPESEALSHVSHVAVFNDVSARDMQSRARAEGNPWDLSKGIDTFGPMSVPVPVGEVPPLDSLHLTLTVNGEVRQDGNTRDMIFGIPWIISYISGYMTLEEGDVIITGTPEGVSEIRRGDTVCASIDGIGSVTNRVV